MQYTGLMSDVDGTLIPYRYDAIPTDAVAKAIIKAQEKVTVSLVTGRSYSSIQPILRKLGLSEGYAVVNNGAAVVNIATDETLYERFIEPDELEEIIALFSTKNIPFYLKQSAHDSKYLLTPYKNGDTIKHGSMLFTEEIFSAQKVDELLDELSRFNYITAIKQHHRDPLKYSLSISHTEATKLHGVHEIAERIDKDPKTFIGAGDSYNDFPLLMACGLKVAMGNAVPDLKAIADYVAPSVEEDGVAHVIERFILNDT